MVTIAPLDPLTCPAADLEAWCTVQRAVTATDSPGDPGESSAFVIGALRHSRHPQRVWAARNGAGTIVGGARVLLDPGANRHVGEARLLVHPDARRRGIGSALLLTLTEALRADGRTTLVVEAADGGAGEAFALNVGAERGLADTRSVQRLDLLPGLPALCRDAVARAERSGHRLVAWTGACPDELVEGYAAARHAMASTPLGGLDWATELWTATTVRRHEEVSAARGQDLHVVVALGPSGVVAFTDLYVTRAAPRRAGQGETAVIPAARGRGLGLAVKAAQLLRLDRIAPEVREVETWNAAINEHMLAVNTALGYRPSSRRVEWERGPRDA